MEKNGLEISEKEIREFIEGDEIRGRIREDGGDIIFDAVEGEVVRVCMTAACATCPAGRRTVRHFVERKLREKFSPALAVEARYVKHYYRS
ncbi:MAG TPA: NifU family protein [Candidatus Brocadiia bacterium]|nr:NifU family protein [Candidatus Brocadiia bacterium]